MSLTSSFHAPAVVLFALTASVNAQALVEKNISMRMALTIIDGTIEQCAKDGYKISVVVVDRAGNVAASVRGDGTKPHMLEFARLKAYTALTNPRGMTSLEFRRLTDNPESGKSYLKQIPGIIAVGGGIPIRAGNEIIGAVGVSGAPGEELDEVCANAGVARVTDSLR